MSEPAKTSAPKGAPKTRRRPKVVRDLTALPAEAQAKVTKWLLEGTPFPGAKLLLEQELGIRVTNAAALARFWSEVCLPTLVTRQRRLAEAVQAQQAEAGPSACGFAEATRQALWQLAYQMVISSQRDSDKLKTVLTLLLKDREQELRERQLRLAETGAGTGKEKAAAAPEAATSAGLTAEARAEIERQLLLL
jgi:hypothetical protein